LRRKGENEKRVIVLPAFKATFLLFFIVLLASNFRSLSVYIFAFKGFFQPQSEYQANVQK